MNLGPQLTSMINAAPQPLRDYIMELETQADPSGHVRDIAALKENCAHLEALVAAGVRVRLIRCTCKPGQYPCECESTLR